MILMNMYLNHIGELYLFKSILKFLDGKDYYELTKQEKSQLRQQEYSKVMDLYILTSNTFLVFGIIIIALVLKGSIDLAINSSMFILVVGITVFLIVVSIFLFIQRNNSRKSKRASIKYDIFINFVILLFLTAMTLANIERGGYIALYAVGLITFGLLAKVKPHIVLSNFILMIVIIVLYLRLNTVSLSSPISFSINIIAINIIIFIASRMVFIEHVKIYQQQKKINAQNLELTKLNTSDFLTNTYNKRGFATRIKEPIVFPAAICIFDVDGLKLINDAFGHEKGDQAIIFVAETIKKVFKEAFCARIGGDEFVIIVENINKKKVKAMINRFTKEMERSSNIEILISASVGYDIVTTSDNLLESLKRAENIMYHLKLGARSSRKINAMNVLMSAMYENTGETKKHCQSVGHISQQILGKIGYARKDDIDAIKTAGKLHDIGKISIPQSILYKEEKLTKIEWQRVRLHSEESYKIACGLIDNKEIADAILYHHEHWDGNGYPYGIAGDNIPLFARILHIADAYDAMVNKQDYRPTITHEKACEELLKNKGTQFDPNIVDAFLKIDFKELKN